MSQCRYHSARNVISSLIIKGAINNALSWMQSKILYELSLLSHYQPASSLQRLNCLRHLELASRLCYYFILSSTNGPSLNKECSVLIDICMRRSKNKTLLQQQSWFHIKVAARTGSAQFREIFSGINKK